MLGRSHDQTISHDIYFPSGNACPKVWGGEMEGGKKGERQRKRYKNRDWERERKSEREVEINRDRGREREIDEICMLNIVCISLLFYGVHVDIWWNKCNLK